MLNCLHRRSLSEALITGAINNAPTRRKMRLDAGGAASQMLIRNGTMFGVKIRTNPTKAQVNMKMLANAIKRKIAPDDAMGETT
jgi:hypothetical protein